MTLNGFCYSFSFICGEIDVQHYRVLKSGLEPAHLPVVALIIKKDYRQTLIF